MAQFIVNPRRAPRAPARCRVTVVCAAGTFEAATEDIGPRGCQLVSPARFAKGDGLELTISSAQVPSALRMPGVVAWASEQPPWRAGVAFDDALLAMSGRWFERLVAATPGLGTFQRVPERIPLDASIYLGPPPRFLLDFTVDEAMLLRAIASGVRLDELQARLRADWPAAQRALFSLMARHLVTLSRGQAAHPDAWKKILAEIEASLALETLGGGAPASVTVSPPPRPPPAASSRLPGPAPGGAPTPPPIPAPVPAARAVPAGRAAPAARAAGGEDSGWGVPARDPHPLLELEDDDGPPLDLLPFAADPVAADPVAPKRPGPRGRSPEAQAAFERALAQAAGGDVSGAVSLLRRALALAPGDSEIAEALGKLAFKDRLPGGRTPHDR
jgi:hypothetical protein